MSPAPALALALIALGGAAIAVQAPINAALSRSVGSPAAAAAVSFGVGFAALVVLTLATGGPAPAARLASVPAWQLAGGLLGAYYVWSMVFGVGSVGVLAAVAAMILGQMLAALALDQAGAFGMAAQAVTPKRVLAVLLVGAGLVLSRS